MFACVCLLSSKSNSRLISLVSQSQLKRISNCPMRHPERHSTHSATEHTATVCVTSAMAWSRTHSACWVCEIYKRRNRHTCRNWECGSRAHKHTEPRKRRRTSQPASRLARADEQRKKRRINEQKKEETNSNNKRVNEMNKRPIRQNVHVYFISYVWLWCV